MAIYFSLAKQDCSANGCQWLYPLFNLRSNACKQTSAVIGDLSIVDFRFHKMS